MAGDEINGMATEQGLYGLVAYYRFKSGKTPLFDMNDVEIEKAIPGDLTGDGSVDMKDILMLRKCIAGVEGLTEEQLKRADVDGDGTVNMKDVLKLRKTVAGVA